MIRRALATAGVVAASLMLVGASPPQPPIRLSPIAVHFYYSDRGLWSPDKLDSKHQFTGWNSVIGEGDSGGALDDAMVGVAVSAPGNDEVAIFAGAPVTITATAGKKLLGKRVARNLLIPAGGRAFTALYLTDIPCAGRIDLKAECKGQVRTARLNMDCGE